jgi:hypothetical protein
MLEHWPQGLQIGLPNLMVILFFFQPWGQYKAMKLSIYYNLGQIEKFFPISALTPSVKRALLSAHRRSHRPQGRPASAVGN